MYFYDRDAFLNIKHVFDKNGNVVVSYKCNAYGQDGVIYGSSEVSNPFHIWALSAYVRYYTDSGAKGTSYGLAIEWMYHNIGNFLE